ncbi:MAG: hypothetical protein Q7S87_05145 [Agitococcus sp.]|nr:hypothetical protein [Agitococcus sp.]
MELVIDKKAFKVQAIKQHGSLASRGIIVKLSDVQESLAVSLGYANLATLYAAFKHNAHKVVDSAVFLAQPENLFVISWMFPDDASGCADEEIIVYRPGTTLDDTASRYHEKVAALRDESAFLPEGFALSADTIGLETFCIVPRPDRYGLPDIANPKAASKHVLEQLGFRIPKMGVETGFTDSGDDGGGIDNLLIWVNNSDAGILRSLFNIDELISSNEG